MKSRPILFSTPMVQAILAGRKTQTRRLVKPQPDTSGVSFIKNPPLEWGNEEWKPWFYDTDEGERISTHCPYGEPGDTIWVREAWSKINDNIIYKADFGNVGKVAWNRCEMPWKPSIHMPRKACRIMLEITAIRVEQVNEISESDAIQEGIEPDPTGLYEDERGNEKMNYKNYGPEGFRYVSPIQSFQSLWESINGIFSWHTKPWVWVIEFKVITPKL